MTALDYSDASCPIRTALSDAHIVAWDRLSRPGTWLTGAERVAVMAEARHARRTAYCADLRAAMSPYNVDARPDTLGEVPENWVELIHRLVCDPGRLTEGWYRRVIESGVAETEYVEIVSIVAHITAIDTFARGLGIPERPLPEPQDGEPSRYRPAEARQHEAWVPNISRAEHGPNEADYFSETTANIQRALTLVPDEARGFFKLVAVQYLSRHEMFDFANEYRAISHAQIELLASRVSAINQCTY